MREQWYHRGTLVELVADFRTYRGAAWGIPAPAEVEARFVFGMQKVFCLPPLGPHSTPWARPVVAYLRGWSRAQPLARFLGGAGGESHSQLASAVRDMFQPPHNYGELFDGDHLDFSCGEVPAFALTAATGAAVTECRQMHVSVQIYVYQRSVENGQGPAATDGDGRDVVADVGVLHEAAAIIGGDRGAQTQDDVDDTDDMEMSEDDGDEEDRTYTDVDIYDDGDEDVHEYDDPGMWLEGLVDGHEEDGNGHRSGTPASAAAIEGLQRTAYEKGAGRGTLRGSECVICTEDFLPGVEIIGLPCSHSFHGPCILGWLAASHTCPLCPYKLPV